MAALQRKARKGFLDPAGYDLERRREIAHNLQRESAHFRQYAPVVEAAR